MIKSVLSSFIHTNIYFGKPNMEDKKPQAFWEKTLAEWDGSTEDTFNSNEISSTSLPFLPSLTINVSKNITDSAVVEIRVSKEPLLEISEETMIESLEETLSENSGNIFPTSVIDENTIVEDVTLDGASSEETLTGNPEETSFSKNLDFTEVSTEKTAILDSHHPPSKPSDDFNQYTILDEIARGGMGIVFKGYQRNLERHVAIKKLLSAVNNPKKIVQFIAESKVTAFLDHPNIVPVYDIGQNPQGEIILVMKLVSGTSWKDILKKRKHREENLDKHIQTLLTVCNAIAFAHSKGIVHNDLKPNNIMVGEFGEVLVMDWGIAVDASDRDLSDSIVLHKSLIKEPLGTPCYMPPELAEGKGENIGTWTDVYLLGAILYEVLMGSPPHMGNSPAEILCSIYRQKKLPWNEKIAEELKLICEKAMEPDISKRYQNVGEFQVELESFLQHRESILIAQEAQEVLLRCQEKIKISDEERNQLYDDFAHSIASFHQSMKLWPENPKAITGEQQARMGYAYAALRYKDFGLAKSQAGKLSSSDPKTNLLQKEIEEKEAFEKRSGLSRRLSMLSLLFLCIFTFRFILLLSFSKGNGPEFLTSTPLQIWLSGIFWVISLLFYRIFSSNKYGVSTLFRLAAFYEIISVIAGGIFIAGFSWESNAEANGIFPPVLMLSLFHLTVPYNRKSAFFISFTAATGGVVTFFVVSYFLGNYPLPPGISKPYIVQHYMIVAIFSIISGSSLSSEKKHKD